MKPNLVLIRGNSGAGKSTLAKKLCNVYSTTEIFHLEADRYFMDTDDNYHYNPKFIGAAHEWCQNSTKRLLEQGNSVVVSNTFTTIRELRPYFEIALEFGILPSVILMQNDYGNIHDVPAEVIAKMKNRFQYDISDLINSYKVRLENEFSVESIS